MSKILLYDKDCILYDINNNNKKVEKLNEEDLVYFSDLYSHDHYNSLTQRHGKPNRLLFDVECSVEPQEFEAIFIPALNMGLLTWVLPLFKDNNIKFSNSVTTDYCCNFSINRKHYDRHIFLKLVEEVFPDINVDYTWHGESREFDLGYLFDELECVNNIDLIDDIKSKLLSPIRMPAQWKVNQKSKNKFNGARMLHGNYLDNWTVAHKKLCETSAVCLLTESFSNNHKNYTFTEKTLYGILGLNFLIWVGNYGQADVAKTMGIDIFEDIIDHSYQYENTIFERCYFAIERNIEILTNVEFANSARQSNLKRLIENRNYMLQDGFKQWVQQEILRYDLQNLIKII